MIDQLIHLCRIYHADENFRNQLESKYKEIAGNMDDSKERFRINSYFVYTEKTRHLCTHSSACEFPQVELRYQINRHDARYPYYGVMCIPYSKQLEGTTND